MTPGGTVRLHNFDLLRIAAIMAVVTIHAASYPLTLAASTHPLRWWVAAVLDGASQWAVPAFVMISGAFVLGSNREEDVASFYRRRLQSILVPAVFWIAAYFVFRAWYLHQSLTPQVIVTDLLLARPFTHLYFLYIIAGLYLATPVLRLVTRAEPTVRTIAIVVSFGIPAAERLTATAFGVSATLTGFSLWLPYVGYYLAGAMLIGVRLTPRASRIALAALAALLVVSILWPAFAPAAWGSYYRSHLSLLDIGATLLIFLLVARHPQVLADRPHVARFVSQLAGLSFGVYLVHEMVLFMLDASFPVPFATGIGAVRLPLLIAATAFVSAALVAVATRIPVAREVV